MLWFIMSNLLILKILSHVLCVSLCMIPFVSGLVKEEKQDINLCYIEIIIITQFQK